MIASNLKQNNLNEYTCRDVDIKINYKSMEFQKCKITIHFTKKLIKNNKQIFELLCNLDMKRCQSIKLQTENNNSIWKCSSKKRLLFFSFVSIVKEILMFFFVVKKIFTFNDNDDSEVNLSDLFIHASIFLFFAKSYNIPKN